MNDDLIRKVLESHDYEKIQVFSGSENRYVMFREKSGNGWFEMEGSKVYGLNKMHNSICCDEQKGIFCPHCLAGINGNVIYIGRLKNK
ncbi:MAG: hypothetical protein AABX88_02875 [Nanoarchaeota archaeon]